MVWSSTTAMSSVWPAWMSPYAPAKRSRSWAGPARALRRSGVPLSVIERSARLAAVVPVIGVGLPVVGFGAFCGLVLSGGNVMTEGSSGLLVLIGQIVAGLVLVAVTGAAGAPVLRKASAN